MFAPGILWFLLNRLRDPGLGYLGWMDGVHQVMWWWPEEVNLTGWRFDGVVQSSEMMEKSGSFWVFFLQKSRRLNFVEVTIPKQLFFLWSAKLGVQSRPTSFWRLSQVREVATFIVRYLQMSLKTLSFFLHGDQFGRWFCHCFDQKFLTFSKEFHVFFDGFPTGFYFWFYHHTKV